MARTYRIVVGVDGSEGGRRALDWALADAARHRGVVHAVLAYEATGAGAGERMLAEALEAARAGYPAVPLTGDTIQGQAAAVLVRAARSADLLVLGSHGHGRMFQAVLGSVAEECIRAAGCPVAVIPAPHAARTEHTVERAVEHDGPITTAVY